MGDAVLGILIGLASGLLAGAFGVGGAIVSTPGVQLLVGTPPIVAVGTPLPVILPATLSGSVAYRRAGHVDARSVRWAAPAGAAAAAGGASLTAVVNPHVLLLVTALLIGWQAVRVGVGLAREPRAARDEPPAGWALAAGGAAAGLASGLLGIGGGIVLVPFLHGLLGMPLKRALGTSLVVIAFVVIPGTAVHAALGHIDWEIFVWLTIGVIPGAALGSRWSVRARERTLRMVVAAFMLVIAVGYAVVELRNLIIAWR